MLIDLIIGLLISGFIAVLAYLKHSLNLSGFIASIVMGTLIYMFGGIVLFSTLIAFFISSSLLTKLHEKKAKDLSKGRNYIQVISNGLVATLFSVLYYFLNTEIFLIAAVAAIATSNADTWASEIGILSKGKTRNITNFKEVAKGVSGAISGLGTLASIGGSLFIGLIFGILYYLTNNGLLETIIFYTLVISICGVLGCLVDSFLGSIVQAKYIGLESNNITEKKFLPNEQVLLHSGYQIITNDAVNFLSSLFASILTLIFII